MWADLWDDCGAFADRTRYRRAIHAIFIEGVDPPQEGDDDDDAPSQVIDPKTGKVRRVPRRASTATPDITNPIPAAAMAKLQELRERVQRGAVTSTETEPAQE